MAVLFGPQNITHTWGARMLARIPMAGGSRRDMLSGVVDADWIPGTDALAVIRDTGGNRPWTVEFPAGTTVHETRGRVVAAGVTRRQSCGVLRRSDDVW